MTEEKDWLCNRKTDVLVFMVDCWNYRCGIVVVFMSNLSAGPGVRQRCSGTSPLH